MSNEKPVRITVGDVKEVTEATTIQSETSAPKSASSVSYTASVPDTSGNAMVYGAGFVGFVLLVVAGYFGLGQSQPNMLPETFPKPPAMLGSRPMGNPDAKAPANNAPAATNKPAGDATANNAPAANTPADKNAPASNAPAAGNSPAANNATK